MMKGMIRMNKKVKREVGKAPKIEERLAQRGTEPLEIAMSLEMLSWLLMDCKLYEEM